MTAAVRATIKEKREVAKGTLLVVFDLQGEQFEYRRGDDLNASSYMVAGPPGMAAAATEALKTIGVDEHLISTDSFSGY